MVDAPFLPVRENYPMIDHANTQKRREFDPFRNRLCRDIRNDLSESLMTVIHTADSDKLSPVVERYKTLDLEPCMSDYLNDRLTRYHRVFKQIKSAGMSPDETYAIAVLLWNQELFFEVHEWLEEKWLKAIGTEKVVVQALIRAAGTYVHLEHGRREGAKKMALKAVASLLQHQTTVPPVFNVESLVAKLTGLDPVPPKFGEQ